MAKRLNRKSILTDIYRQCGWVVDANPIPDLIDSDTAIDVFGKLAKADVTDEMLTTLIEHEYFQNTTLCVADDRHDPLDERTLAFVLDPKKIKAAYEKCVPKDSKKKEVVEKVVTKEVVVEPSKIDTTAFVGALGKAVGESLVGEYGKAIAESAMPQIREMVKAEFGKVVRKVEVVVPERGKSEGVFHECFDEVLTYLAGGDNVMLVGESGTGKNVICKQASEALGLPFYFANKVSDEYQLKGYMDANGEFVSTPLYHAMKDGGLFMLDEMDASSEEALLVLDSVLANHYLSFPNGEFVESHKDFRVIAGCNTFGTGATYMYTGRRQQDAALLNRFMTVEVGYSPTIEESLSDDEELIKFVRKFRACCKEFGINHVVSYRNLIMLDKYVDAVGIDKALRSALLKNLEKDDLTMLKGRFSDGADRWSSALMRAMA